jgi:nickel transport protein
MNTLIRLALSAALAAGALSASAHEAWVEPLPAGGFSVHYGHGDKKDPFDPAKVKDLRAFDAAGQRLAVAPSPQADGMTLAVSGGTPALLTIFFDNGFWSRGAPEAPMRNVPKNENPGATSGSHSLKTGKTVLGWGPAVTQPRGLRLEIVPTAAAAPRAGGQLPVQVLWDGQPLPGAKLSAEGYEKGKEIVADAMGRASVPVVAGWQMLTAAHELPMPGDPRADRARYSANLFFTAR